MTTCPHCDSPDLIQTPNADGPAYARLDCGECGRWLKWVEKPLSLESVAAFVMPFGKHKGTPIRDIPRDYLRWGAGNLGSTSMRRKFQFYLDATEEPPR